MSTSLEEQEEEQFYRLNLASAVYWHDSNNAHHFRIYLAEASAKNINRIDSIGWSFLTYVIWRYKGLQHETETLKYLLGPEVLHEDHSRLRLDKRIWSDGELHIPMLLPTANGYTAMDLLKLRSTIGEYVGTRRHLPIKDYQIAHSLLQNAIDRVATYPDRLLKTLNEVCALYFPIVPLYSIVVEYIVWK
jgi:hypothetical protein